MALIGCFCGPRDDVAVESEFPSSPLSGDLELEAKKAFEPFQIAVRLLHIQTGVEGSYQETNQGLLQVRGTDTGRALKEMLRESTGVPPEFMKCVLYRYIRLC